MFSEAPTELIDARRLTPSGLLHNEKRRRLKRRLIKSPSNDRGQWWATKAEEMKRTAAMNSSGQPFRLIEETNVNENISGKDKISFHFQPRRLSQWTEHSGV